MGLGFRFCSCEECLPKVQKAFLRTSEQGGFGKSTGSHEKARSTKKSPMLQQPRALNPKP